MTILHVDSSPLGAASASRKLTAAAVAALSAHHRASVMYRDLCATPPAHLTAELMRSPKERAVKDLHEHQAAELALTERLVEEFLSANIIVVGAPMYNFSIPTQLKAWIDRLAQPGITFRYTDAGPVGLSGGRKVVIVSTRGGVYSGSPSIAAMDHQESYLRTVFGFFGITDITVVRAEGLAMGAADAAAAMTAAEHEIAALADALTD